MIQGSKIRLRVISREDLSELESWNSNLELRSSFNNFGLQPTNSLEHRFADDGLIGTRFGTLLVVLPDGTIVGDVSYHQERYGPNDGSTAYNIGIELMPDYRGKGYGVEAQKLLADYLFSTYPVMRIEASTDIENIPEQRALEKAGFTREGVLRKAQWRSGGYHDIVLYSKLRGE